MLNRGSGADPEMKSAIMLWKKGFVICLEELGFCQMVCKVTLCSNSNRDA